MKPIQIISQDLFDKIRSRFQNLEMGDMTGAVTIDPAEAVFFDFDFIYEGTNLGRVSVSLNDLGSLKVYYSQGITENKDDFSKKIWYDFLKEMRLFAMRRLLRFDTRDITKSNLDKNDFQQLATTQGPKEDSNMKMNESRWNHRSTKKTSRAVKGQTEVIVRHTESMEEMAPGLRSHPKKIKAIFVQSREGERWKAPFNYPDLGFAMANHVDHGGVPHDPAGKAIVRMAEQIVQLGKFQKEIKQSTLHDDALKITEKAIGRLNELKAQMKALAKRHHYESWIAEFVEPEDTELNELDPVTLETYRSTFTASSFNENLAGLFPLIHSIMQEKIDLEEYVNESNNDNQMVLNGKPIDPSSLEVDGIDRRDHPDYADAYFSNAEYSDGTPLSDAELDQLTDMYGDVVNQMVFDKIYEDNGNEFAQFEQWAEAVETGTLAQDQVQALAAKLKEMQASGETLEFGPEGTTAFAFFQEYGINSEQLPDEVVNDLQEKLKQDAEDASFDDNADPMNTFKAWANEHQPDLVSQLGLSAAEPAAEPAPAEPAPAEPAAEPAPVEQPVAEAKDDWIAEVAKLVKSRYNAANESVGPFNGIEGIALDIKKRIAEKFGDKLGEKAELVAKQYMEQLMHQWESKHGKPAMQSTDDNDGLHIQRLKELIGNVKTKLESMVNSEESNQGIDKDKETKFHTDLDNLVHKTFGKRPEENPKEAMSQHAKGWEKYGPGMKELAKAGKAGASEKEMDRIRKKHDRYDEDLDLIRKLAGMAK